MNWEFGFRCGKRFPLYYNAAGRTVGHTWPPVHRLLGGNSAVVKRLEREYNHSCLHSAKVMNAWSYSSTEACVFVAWCCTENGDGFCTVLI